MAVLEGGEKLQRALADIGRRLGRGGTLKVGFLEGATYPDGTSVAMVAAINEFGRTVRSSAGDYYQLARPFFRNMIAKHGSEWPSEIEAQLKSTNYDTRLTMNRMGVLIEGEIQQSINDLRDPPLAPSTIRAKGFDKPLIHRAIMINSVASEYEER